MENSGVVGMERKEKRIIFSLFFFFSSPQTKRGFRCFSSAASVSTLSSSFFFCFLRSHHKQPPSLSAGLYNNVKVRNQSERKGKKKERRKKPSDTRDQGNDNEATSGFFSFHLSMRVFLLFSI
jgi:hypothetical protein